MVDDADRRCGEVSEDGLPCQKRRPVLQSGEVLEYHGGGHSFATDEVWAKVQNWHYDATDILAGRATAAHPPEECPGPEHCTTARYRRL